MTEYACSPTILSLILLLASVSEIMCQIEKIIPFTVCFHVAPMEISHYIMLLATTKSLDLGNLFDNCITEALGFHYSFITSALTELILTSLKTGLHLASIPLVKLSSLHPSTQKYLLDLHTRFSLKTLFFTTFIFSDSYSHI